MQRLGLTLRSSNNSFDCLRGGGWQFFLSIVGRSETNDVGPTVLVPLRVGTVQTVPTRIYSMN